MADTLDAAIEALRRQHFYDEMAKSETRLRSDPSMWSEYLDERDAWLNPDSALA